MGGLSTSLLVLTVTKSSILANPRLPNAVELNGLTPTFYSFLVFKKQIFANYASQPKLAHYSEFKRVREHLLPAHMINFTTVKMVTFLKQHF